MATMCYYKNQCMRTMRFVKRTSIALFNRFRGYSNKAKLLEYHQKYYPLTTYYEYQNENAFYGISHILKTYSGFHRTIPATIEHGVYFGEYTGELEKFNLPAVITFGDWRLEGVRRATDRPVFLIGPYIAYVDISQYEEEIRVAKENLGKVLLVFPAHSIECMNLDYDETDFGSFISAFAKDHEIDTVLVSLYFKDIPVFAPIYEKLGWKVVCSGYRTDRDFLKRQKAMLSLADYVVTNSVGTHIGYAVAMEKPVSLFSQAVNLSSESRQSELSILEQDAYRKNRAEVEQAFSGIHLQITETQIQVVNKFWGLHCLVTREELKMILDSIEWIWKKSRSSRKSYRELMMEYIQTRTAPKEIELLVKSLNE